jgi:RNA polymerase sigma-70 factor (ECF subfamily)
MSNQPNSADGIPFPSTSLSLLERVKVHDAEAWRRLVHIYGPLIYQWCRRGQLRQDDAADVAQEVFRAVATRIGAFQQGRPGGSFRAWLWTITRHKIGDHIRRARKAPGGVGGTDAHDRLLQLPEQLPADDLDVTDVTRLVHRALAEIRPEFEERTWQAFWRAAALGHAPRDIAADLGVSPDAVRMAKSRVLRRLRDELPDLAE